MQKVKYLIIGAGPTGLGAAHRLKEIGEESFLVLDKSSFAGGLSSSFKDEVGFTWDIGGHVQFSHYQYFDEVMEKALGENGWNHHQRESWVWIKDRFVPYPFQNNIHRLDKEDQDRILNDLENRNLNHNPKNFKEWLTKMFGQSLYELFMGPYNKKVWAFDPSKLNVEWMQERVATVDIDRIKKNIINDCDDVSWGPNNTFQFPKEGGTGAIWKNVADQIGSQYFKFDHYVDKIDFNKQIVYSNNSNIQYEKLLSTIPLDCLIQNCEKLRHLSSEFVYSTTHVIGLGIQGELPPSLKKKCWMYFPEDEFPFYRLTVFSHYADKNVPSPGTQYSLMLEVAESSDKEIKIDSAIVQSIHSLIKIGFIENEERIISKWRFKAKYGYPTPFLGRDQLLKKIHPELLLFDVYSRGRFGGWKYEVSNQDHSFMQGVEWVNHVEYNDNEETYTW